MTTQLYSVHEKNNSAKSSYAIITNQKVGSDSLEVQIILLKDNYSFYYYKKLELLLIDDKFEARVESILTRGLGLDISIKVQDDYNLPMLLEERFSLIEEDVYNLTIDKEFKKVLEKHRNLRS